MRDYALLVFFLALLPVCVWRPFMGALLWYVVGYLNPHRMTWGFAQEFPFAALVAAATLVGVLGLALRGGPVRVPWERETFLILGLWLFFFLSALFAIHPETSWPEFEKVSKVLLMTFVAMALIDDFQKFRWMAWVIVASVGFYGVKGGVFTILTGGNYLVFGPQYSSIADNTAIGLALNMTLPLMFFMARTETSRWLRRGLHAAFLLSALAVVFTYSRGSMLGLAAVCGLLFLRLQFRLKVAIAVLVFFSAPIAISQIPDHWFDKMSTLETYQEDSSAMSRIEAWKASWNLALDRPLVGGGFNAIQNADVYLRYNPDVLYSEVGAYNTGVHSSYFEIIGENGLVAFGFYFLLMMLTLASCRSVRLMAAATNRQDMVEYAWALQIGIIGYAVSGAFLEFGGFDLYYHLVAMVIVAKSLLRRELLAVSPAERDQVSAALPLAMGPLSQR